MGKNYGKSVSLQVMYFKSAHEEYVIVTHRLHLVQVECVCYFCILYYKSAISCFMWSFMYCLGGDPVL